MVEVLKNCLKLSMKCANSVIGMVGIAMVLYSLWLVWVWQHDMEQGSSSHDFTSFPWFIHAFIGLGISLCAITCLGHVAANTANACCLSCYISVNYLLLLLETALMADVFLNSDWEKDLPEDPTGKFDDFKDFVNSNMDICKYIGLMIVLAQGFAIIFATLIRNLAKDRGLNYDSDDDSAPPRLPLLNPNFPVQPLPRVDGVSPFGFINYP